jgi:excisionase family DNA binding protein
VRAKLLTLSDVADLLNVSMSQAYALVRNGELQGLHVGGRNQWRVDPDDLDAYIDQAKQRAGDFVRSHPFTGKDRLTDD